MSTMTSRLSSMVNSWSSALDQRRAGRGWIMSGAPQKDPDASKQFRQTTPVVGARGIHSTDRKWVEPVFEGPRAKLATTCSTREGVPTHRVCSTCRFFHLKKNSLLFFYFHLSLSCWGLRYLKPTGDFLYFFDSVQVARMDTQPLMRCVIRCLHFSAVYFTVKTANGKEQ